MTRLEEPTTSTQTEDFLLDHDYDGIQEYDNPLPGWWRWIFWASVIFSIAYILWRPLPWRSVYDQHERAMAAHVDRLLAQLGDIQGDNATIVEFMVKEDWMSATRGMFASNCGPCHNSDGSGNVGPNLTDDYYKSVNEPQDLFTVISDGVEGTSMKGWADRLAEPQRILLAAYVASLRGTLPGGGKTAEGSKIDPWPAPPPVTDDAAAGDS